MENQNALALRLICPEGCRLKEKYLNRFGKMLTSFGYTDLALCKQDEETEGFLVDLSFPSFSYESCFREMGRFFADHPSEDRIQLSLKASREVPLSASLPCLYVFALLAQGKRFGDEEEEEFKRIVKVPFASFMTLDLQNDFASPWNNLAHFNGPKEEIPFLPPKEYREKAESYHKYIRNPSCGELFLLQEEVCLLLSHRVEVYSALSYGVSHHNVERVNTAASNASSLSLDYESLEEKLRKAFEKAWDGTSDLPSFEKEIDFYSSYACQINAYLEGKGGCPVENGVAKIPENPVHVPTASTKKGAVPPKIIASIKKAKQRIDAFVGEESSFRFAFFTDLHAGHNEKATQYRYFAHAAKVLQLDLAVNGGDIGLDDGETPNEASKLLYDAKKGMESLPCPALLLKGNHDYGPGRFPNEFLNAFFHEKLEEKSQGTVHLSFDEDGGQYGAYFDEKTRTHLFFLNTTEGDRGGYFLSNKQLSWLIQSLSEVREGEGVLLLGHYCPYPCGAWKGDLNYQKIPSVRALARIMKDFASHSAGEEKELGLAWDFSSLRKVRCYGYLCGDSHFDAFSQENQLNIIVRQGYGGVDQESLPSGAKVNFFSWQDDCDFDVMVIKESGKAKLFRVGANSEAGDITLLP